MLEETVPSLLVDTPLHDYAFCLTTDKHRDGTNISK